MQTSESVLAIGLMSGTSMDGIDAALIRTDGQARVEPLAFVHVPYGDGPRDMLRAAMAAALLMPKPGPQAAIDKAGQALTLWHVSAVQRLLEEAGVKADDVRVLGFHGQTIAHRPDRGWTWQIGEGALLARMTGIDVVNDFRSADVAAGGQGAPLVPIYHAALTADLPKPLVVLNIGGVANVTWIGEQGQDLLAFDTGPGNALIDDWILTKTGKSYDKDGALAASGYVHRDVLNQMLANVWLDVVPPKSLDRSDFSSAPVSGLTVADGAATLTAFTAETIAAAIRHLPATPQQWLVGGGGRHNHTLMAMLREQLEAPVQSVDALGIDGDALEAQAFAYLAVRSVRGLPLSFPGTTGVEVPTCGGVLCRRG
jgi:anhydro-N-acetylmuramic acid kinase